MEYIRKYWYIVCIALFGFGYILFISLSVPNSSHDSGISWEEALINTEEVGENLEEEKIKQDKIIKLFVDIKGEVNLPGVYEVHESTRVIDVIKMAGGFTDLADQKGVNLAEKIVDEMVIYVPVLGEDILNWTNSVSLSSAQNDLININKALTSELETLPGIGPSKASAIIAYREENGHFQSIEDLKNVPGIGEKSLVKLKEYISVK